jgi:hypothetical protein
MGTTVSRWTSAAAASPITYVSGSEPRLSNPLEGRLLFVSPPHVVIPFADERKLSGLSSSRMPPSVNASEQGALEGADRADDLRREFHNANFTSLRHNLALRPCRSRPADRRRVQRRRRARRGHKHRVVCQKYPGIGVPAGSTSMWTELTVSRAGSML